MPRNTIRFVSRIPDGPLPSRSEPTFTCRKMSLSDHLLRDLGLSADRGVRRTR